MAIMIPPEIPDSAPESEKIIFENLMRAPQARDWVVFHSIHVDNSDDLTKPYEIDFLILIPEYFAVICLETKGGSYRIKNGLWHLLSSRKRVTSPFVQAQKAMFALKNEFSPYFTKGSLLSLRCAVAFTHSIFPEGVRKPKETFVIEKPDTQDPDKLGKKLMGYTESLPTPEVSNNREKLLETLEVLDNLRHDLEPPDMTLELPPERIFRADLENLRPQLLRLTTDQFSSLKRVALNERCVIDGAAGTGKTVLAMELARQRCEVGETVALLCSNPYLSRRFAKWAETLPDEDGGRVVAGTPATLPFWALRSNPALKDKHQQRLKKWPKLEGSLKLGYLDDGWHPFIDETVSDLKQEGIFDYLIVDEAQNLCDEVFLKLMDKLLKNGLVEGYWTMFGDFVNQDIVSPRFKEDGQKENGTQVLKDFGLNWSNDVLETNCRNTHEIAETVARLVDIESPPISGVHGPRVQIEYFESQEELDNVMEQLISGLKSRDFASRQIILLSWSDDDGFNTERAYSGWKLFNIRDAEKTLKGGEDPIDVGSDPSRDALRYSDIYDFQGLESEVAILVLPVTEDHVVLGERVALPYERHLNRVLYTGMSRAKALLVIIAHKNYKETLVERWELYD